MNHPRPAMSPAPRVSATKSVAQRLFNQAFGIAREPKSAEYKAGALAALRHRSGEEQTMQKCPHQLGTAQADAWHAGVDEARSIWHGAAAEKKVAA